MCKARNTALVFITWVRVRELLFTPNINQVFFVFCLFLLNVSDDGVGSLITTE